MIVNVTCRLQKRLRRKILSAKLVPLKRLAEDSTTALCTGTNTSLGSVSSAVKKLYTSVAPLTCANIITIVLVSPATTAAALIAPLESLILPLVTTRRKICILWDAACAA